MKDNSQTYLTKREQQIMERVYLHGQVDASLLMAELPGGLSNSAVRTHLRILEAKGHLQHFEECGRFVYRPIKARQAAGRSALSQVLRTFFDGSAEKAMATLLSVKEADLSDEELGRLRQMIDDFREKESRKP